MIVLNKKKVNSIMGIWQTIKNFFKSDESPVYRKFAKPPVINFKEIETADFKSQSPPITNKYNPKIIPK